MRLGEETAGIDIYYREIHGHTVAGRIAGASADGSYVRVALRSAATGVGVEDATAEDSPRGPTFRFEDVPDGAYEVVAESWGDKRAISLPRRVEVSGSAVEGLELVLSPLNAIAGRIVVEPARGEPPRACPALRHVLPHEIALELTAVAIDATWRGMWREDGSGTVASREGAFSFEGLLDGRFAIGVGLPDAAWYVQSVSLPAERRDARGAAERQDASGPIRLAGGAHREGLEVVVAHGAASVRGRVAPSNDIRVRVHLLPAEPERAEDVLRYREVAAEPDGTFSLRNVAPGRYRLVAALAAPQAQSESSPPAAWNPKRRDELRRAAESSGLEVELSPCQRAEGLELRLAGTSAVRQLRSGSVE